MKTHPILTTGALLALGLTACGGSEGANGEYSSASGENIPVAEEFILAYNQQPPTMDPLMTTAGVTRNLANLVYEPLIVLDADLEIQPMLAEDYEVNEDNTVITFHLRDDVTFHNGDPMTAADVVASLERWIELSMVGQDYLADAVVESPDEGTVTVTLSGPLALGSLMLVVPDQLPYIMPASVIKEAEESGVTEYIGTGPYEFGTWETDQYIRFDRYGDFVSRNEPPNGLAGGKSAYFEEFQVNFVEDASTRINGLQSGEYDFANIAYDHASMVRDADNLNLTVGEFGMTIGVFNKAQGLMSDVNMRQAVIAAADTESLLLAGYGDEELYWNNSALMHEESPWYIEPDAEYRDFHENANIDQAEEYLERAGYDGETINLLVSSDQDDHYGLAVVLQDQMGDAGMNVDLNVVDWPSLLEIREDPAAQDIFISGVGNTPVLPPTFNFFSPTWAGWTDDEDIFAAAEEFLFSVDDQHAEQAMHDLQEAYFDYAPLLKFGDRTILWGLSDEYEGFEHITSVGPMLHEIRPVE